jgi:hypothetical protein
VLLHRFRKGAQAGAGLEMLLGLPQSARGL